jgi:glucose-1-phosphate cytidylyltransferase
MKIIDKKKVKVVILCGGVGTRLKEETEFKPKPLVHVGTKPIIWHIMKIYSHFGYNNFVLCLGYKGELIKEYFYNYEILNNDFTVVLGDHNNIQAHNAPPETGWSITLVDTGLETLKGARIKKVERFIDGDIFLTTYGDGVAQIDINKLIAFHKEHGKVATISGVHPPSRFGELIVEGDLVKEFSEKPQTSYGRINGGFFVFNREIFNYLEDKESCDLEYGALEVLAKNEQLMMYDGCGFWQCMDTMRDAGLLNKLWESGDAPWKVW